MLTTTEYDALERAIGEGLRVAFTWRGAEHVVLPVRIRATGGREALETTNPSSGHQLIVPLDDMTRLHLVGA
ncbi:MAG: hypothetical protein MUF21_05300 [Gemmatimonadaceae bacterium]|jgi:hypothetical protein|nr:hypothetical protein [Gemmatimonadaceae bacterium]